MSKKFMPETNEWVYDLDEYKSREDHAACLCTYIFWEGDGNPVHAHWFEARRILDG